MGKCWLRQLKDVKNKMLVNQKEDHERTRRNFVQPAGLWLCVTRVRDRKTGCGQSERASPFPTFPPSDPNTSQLDLPLLHSTPHQLPVPSYPHSYRKPTPARSRGHSLPWTHLRHQVAALSVMNNHNDNHSSLTKSKACAPSA